MTVPDGIVDLHSHLVPAVDDGARTVDDALEGIGRMVEAGIRRVVTTPHFDVSLGRDPARFGARMRQIDSAFAELRDRVAVEHPDVVLARGQEVMLDAPFPELTDDRHRLAGTRFVLVEWPRLQIPPATPDVVARIRGQGWIPVIAHPERYRGLMRDFAVVGAWRRAGACLQMNHGSVVGRYGTDVQTAAFRLLEGGWVDCLSSDFHARAHLPLYVAEARSWFEEREQLEVFDLLTRINPGRILDDQLPEAVPSFTIERSFWDRLTGFLRSGDA